MTRSAAQRESPARAFEPAAVEADACLAEVADGLEFLLHVTPVNLEEAWRGFAASGFSRLPELRYRRDVEPVAGRLDAAAFAVRAERELDHYRRLAPDFDGCVVVSDDALPGLMVSGDRLLVGSGRCVGERGQPTAKGASKPSSTGRRESPSISEAVRGGSLPLAAT